MSRKVWPNQDPIGGCGVSRAVVPWFPLKSKRPAGCRARPNGSNDGGLKAKGAPQRKLTLSFPWNTSMAKTLPLC